MELVLASNSPRRRHILENLGLKITICPSNIDESIINPDPILLAQDISHRKAIAVKGIINKPSIIIAADTLVYNNGILGKPVDRQEALQMLKSLSGKCHQVITGFTLLSTVSNKEVVDYEITKVFFKALTDEEINYYIDSGEPIDKAGAYGIQGLASLFVERIEGDYFNVVGLPLYKLNRRLEKDFNVSLLSSLKR